jgi:hypothetical protein
MNVKFLKIFLSSALVFCLCVCFVYSDTKGKGKAPSFVSSSPSYVNLYLTEDKSKILKLAFDESKGTGTGYDTLYASVNFASGFRKYKARSKTETKKTSKGKIKTTFFSFPDIKLKTRYNEKAKKASCPYLLKLTYRKNSKGSKLLINNNIQLCDESGVWDYSVECYIKPSTNSGKPPFYSFFNAKPQLRASTKPYKKKIAIVLNLITGGLTLTCKKGRFPAKAYVLIKDQNGKKVHKGSKGVEKFTYSSG